jgi:hypothetical protein
MEYGMWIGTWIRIPLVIMFRWRSLWLGDLDHHTNNFQASNSFYPSTGWKSHETRGPMIPLRECVPQSPAGWSRVALEMTGSDVSFWNSYLVPRRRCSLMWAESKEKQSLRMSYKLDLPHCPEARSPSLEDVLKYNSLSAGMSSNSMPSAQHISPQLANTLPSELIPITSPQPSTIDLTQSLQARNLQEQLNAFISQTPIKHGAQVLFESRAADHIHITTATDDIVPKARITSFMLFLEIQLFKISKSDNLDANMHKYIPADCLLSTLAQLGWSRPHLKTRVAVINSQLAYTCFNILVTAHTYPMLSLPNHNQQYCRSRLAIALYTSSTILLGNRGKPTGEARLHGWEHVEVDDKYLLNLETDGPTRIQKLVEGTVQKSVRGVTICFGNADGEVILSPLKEEAILLRQIHVRIHNNQETQTANDQGQRQTVSNA